MEHINKWINRIHQGNTLDLLKQMPDNFVDTIVTSPPYWGLRDYGEETNTIWGGDLNCEHAWGKDIKCPTKIGTYGSTETVKNPLLVKTMGKPTGTSFCKKCGCYDNKTEILTEHGWKKFSEINNTDRVGTVIDGNLEYVVPKEYYKYKYNGEMYHFYGQNIDILVTPNHNMWVKKRNSKGVIEHSFEFIKAENVKHGYRISRSVGWIGKDVDTFSLPIIPDIMNRKKFSKNKVVKMDDWCKFLGIYLADGYFQVFKNENTENDREYITNITQIKHKKEVEEVIKKLGFKYNYTKKKDFTIYHKSLTLFLKKLGNTYTKYIPKEFKNLGKKYLAALLDGLMLNGWKRKTSNGMYYYSTSKQLAEDVQEICMKLGYATHIYKKTDKRSSYNRKNVYVVSISKDVLSTSVRNIEKIGYDDYVYCCEVLPSHLLVLRRNGHIFICGNSWYGQLGMEPNVDLYINHMLQITEQLKRVLKPTGVFFLNWGDCYGGTGTKGENHRDPKYKEGRKIGVYPNASSTSKCLVLQNYRTILQMIDQQGWILRNQIVWYKRNGMPSSVTDRLSNKWEPVFMLVKNNNPIYYYNTKTGLVADKRPSKEKQREGIDWDWKKVGADYSNRDTKISLEEAEKLNLPRARVYRERKRKKVSYWQSSDYFFDLDAIRISYTEKLNRWGGEKLRAKGKSNWDNETGQQTYRDRDMRPNKLGKNPGDVLDVPTQPFPGSHFAVFPKKLISPMIKASCPQWICKECKKPRCRISKRKAKLEDADLPQSPRKEPYKQSKEIRVKGSENYTNWLIENPIKTIGWTNCGCNANFEPGIVLDPFVGSGTTAVVAKELGRNFIGLEINPEYITMAKERLIHVAPRIDKWADNSVISNDVVGWKWKI